MIEITDLGFHYTPRAPILRGVTTQLRGGMIYGLLGKNGAGKTTFLKIIMGLLRPNSGEIRVKGYNPTRRQTAFLSSIFYVPEDPFFPSGSLRRFVQSYGPFYPSFSKALFFELLEIFEVDRSVSFSSISFGQRKKAFIAFAIACQTNIIVMDEPTNGLDIPSKRQFRKVINHVINDSRLMIISSHQIRDLHSLIDAVIMVDEGEILIDHSLPEIEECLRFEVFRSEPGDEDLLYYERVPGGYLGVRAGRYDHSSLEIDLEILFNATLDRRDHMKVLLHKTQDYAQA